MKKIWQLYIVLFIFFVVGDMVSTFLIIERQDDVIAGTAESPVPDECMCHMPAHCDRNYLVGKITENPIIKFTILKLILALAILIVVFLKQHNILLSLTVFMILVTGNNFSILLYPLRNILIVAELLLVAIVLQYFVRFKDD